MTKYLKITITLLILVILKSQQAVYASFGGGHGGGHGGGSGGHGSGGRSNWLFDLSLAAVFWGTIFLSKKIKDRNIEKLEKEIKFNQLYKKDFKKLFVDFQDAWTKGNLEPIRKQMLAALYKENKAILKSYAYQGIEARTVDVVVQNVHAISKNGNLLKVRYCVSARDYFVDARSQKIVNKKGKVVRSQAKPKKVNFKEDWVIKVRKNGNHVVQSVKRKES